MDKQPIPIEEAYPLVDWSDEWPEATEEQKKLAEELLKRIIESQTGPTTIRLGP